MSLHFQPSQVRKLRELQHGIYLKSHQIATIRNFGKSLTVEKGSAAAKLLNRLQADPQITFVAHTAHVDEANLITIRNHANVDLASIARLPKNAKSQNPSSSVSTKLSSKELFAQAIINALKLTGGRSLLLCVAWVTKEQVNFLDRFPWVITMDVTFGTNAEKRPLIPYELLNSLFECRIQDSAILH